MASSTLRIEAASRAPRHLTTRLRSMARKLIRLSAPPQEPAESNVLWCAQTLDPAKHLRKTPVNTLVGFEQRLAIGHVPNSGKQIGHQCPDDIPLILEFLDYETKEATRSIGAIGFREFPRHHEVPESKHVVSERNSRHPPQICRGLNDVPIEVARHFLVRAPSELVVCPLTVEIGPALSPIGFRRKALLPFTETHRLFLGYPLFHDNHVRFRAAVPLTPAVSSHPPRAAVSRRATPPSCPPIPPATRRSRTDRAAE